MEGAEVLKSPIRLYAYISPVVRYLSHEPLGGTDFIEPFKYFTLQVRERLLLTPSHL